MKMSLEYGWEKMLKPGDEVIKVSSYGNEPTAILTVKKITPSGIVRTNNGSYKQSKYTRTPYVGGYGNYDGHIEPCTEELRTTAENAMKVEEEKKAVMHRKTKAKNICYKLCYGKIEMTDDLAKQIIAMAELLEENYETD